MRSRPWPAPRPPTTRPPPASLAPLLSLGLPTSATAAIMLAAFQQYGLQPGPLLFENNPELVWGMIASLYIGNVLLLVLNLPMARLWVKAAQDPAALALCRHPGLRHHGRLHAQQQRGRPGDPVGHRHPWLRHAGARRAGRTLRRRPDPRSLGRAAVPPRARRSARATYRCSSPTRSRWRCWSSRCCW